MGEDNKRRNQRMELTAELALKPVGGGGAARPMTVTIEDVSRNGIGFICDAQLKTGDTFEAKLKIWTGETIDVFLQVVRKTVVGTRWRYGAVFIGMSDVDAGRIETYQTIVGLRSE